MPIYYVHYDLSDGFVNNWIAAGPQAIPVQDLGRFAGTDPRLQIAHHYYEEDSGITETPAEQGPLTEGVFKVGDYEGAWSYFRCREDHFIDHTMFYPTCHYLRSWAYVEIMSEAAQEVTLALTTYGPADVWLGGRHVHRQEHFVARLPRSVGFEAALQEGANGILVRFEGVAAGECPFAMALRVCEPASARPVADLRVRLPTTIMQVARRETLERLFQAAYLDQEVFAGNEAVVLRWPEELDTAAEVTVRLQTPSGRIYAESNRYVQGRVDSQATLAQSFQTPGGLHHVVLMPGPTEYYHDQVRFKREFDVWTLGRNSYSEASYGTYAERRREALTDAAQRPVGTMFSEIAKMALGWWPRLKTDVIGQAIASVNQREAGSERCLAGLLGMLYRFGDRPEFPESLKQPLQECILAFRYQNDEPCIAVMDRAVESRDILLCACEILAGQLYPERAFADSGQTGEWHREKGEQSALAWLHQRGANGFEDWDSSGSFADSLLALSHLVDLAQTEQVWEMAAALMDKMLFTIALNSYKGVFGSAHGRACATDVKGGLLEPTAGIARLMWGVGIWNDHLSGFVSLACAENYEPLPILSQVATSVAEEMWSRERHVAGDSSSPGKEREVNKVTYRTPDYMLCSAQDYHPGRQGYREHIWQATLGPAAVVFVTHPACASENDACVPNFWLGNSVLPRVAQWKDVLIAIHNLPEDDWMGFVHAYFPVYAFDEYALRDGWAFARKGEGYLALAASRDLDLVTQGHSAYRELRSYGRHNVWLCHMGRAAQDGDFGAFQEKVVALDVAFDGLSIHCNTLRGEALSFSWEGPLLCNEQELPLTGFKHYENPYCVAELPAVQLEVRSQDYLLRLDFGDIS
jgi:hypothetical protein